MSRRTFLSYFKESMDSLNLPTPDSLFNSIATATATITAMESAISRLGRTATASELLFTAPGGATLAADVAYALAGVSAVFYLGACVGALMCASIGVTQDYFASNNPTNGRAWQVIHRATAMGIAIPNTVYMQIISPDMRNQIIISQNRMA